MVTDNAIVSIYINKVLLEKWREIHPEGEKANFSEFVEQQVEWYINLHSNDEKITCIACAAQFSSKVWLKYTHNKDHCIVCNSTILKRESYGNQEKA